jgi:hypothetical protein
VTVSPIRGLGDWNLLVIDDEDRSVVGVYRPYVTDALACENSQAV